MNESGKKILVGWAGRDVTPSGKVSLWGQHHVRITEEVRDPLTTTALALSSEDGEETAMLVSLDAISVTDPVADRCRRLLSDALPDFAPEMLMMSGTHTHTGPDQLPRKNSLRPELPEDVLSAEAYRDFVAERMCEAAVEAWQNRAPGALSWGRGYAPVGFNRRAAYFDGSSQMYGGTDVPEFSHIEGREDHVVELLFTYDPDRALTGMVVNVPCPSQCTEGSSFISADFWHETREEIRQRHGGHIRILAQCSAAGDQSPRTLLNRDADARMLRLKAYGDDYNEARRQDIADKVAAVVDEVLPLVSTEIHEGIEFAHRSVALELPRRKGTEEELKAAREQVAALTEKLEGLASSDPASGEYTGALMKRTFHQHVIAICEAQQRGENLTLPVELHVLRIGDVAMCSNRFEFFLDFGDRVKARSKALQTFVVQLTGQGNYLLTERAMQGGSYGASVESSPIGPDGGQMVVEATLAAINELFEEQT